MYKLYLVEDLTEIKTVAQALALGVETIYPLPNDDVCSCLTNGECPLDKGEEVTYKLIMPILTSFPKVILLDIIYIFNFISFLDKIVLASEMVHAPL